MKKLFLCIGLVFSMTGMDAQETENETSVTVQIRPRAEYRNGALYPRNEGDEAAGFINNRARMSLDYRRNDLSMKVAAQHVGVWGQDPQIDKNGRFILNEAWAKLYLHNYFYAQLGRQSLIYDDERILGALDWNVAGRYHDALKLGYEKERNKLHLILAFNQNDENIIGGTYYAPGAQPYKSMQTLWYNYVMSHLTLSALFMNLGQEGGDPATKKADTRYLQTFGANAGYNYNVLTLYGTVYFQTGRTAADVSVSAWMASLKASYAVDKKIGLTVGTDYLSGTGSDDAKYKAFNPLYGTHHKFYGTMDYFYASSFQNGLNPGLWDKYAGINFVMSKKASLSAMYHHFSIASDVKNGNDNIKKGLGSEVDLQFNWNIMKNVMLTGGYSVMFGSESMDIVKGGNHDSWQDWGWISLNINPRILFAKW
ncbi:MAG: alginate export family protein [Tannerella sp.]|nr:alginate export family protein [Tannerella sp.]